MFGDFKTTVDVKGRMNIPTKLRDQLGANFFIAKPLDGSNCLSIYSTEDWESLVGKIKSLPKSKTGEIRREILGRAHEVEADKQGRILIPQPLREYAGLDGETMVVCMGDDAEIWNKTAWANRDNTVDMFEVARLSQELDI